MTQRQVPPEPAGYWQRHTTQGQKRLPYYTTTAHGRYDARKLSQPPSQQRPRQENWQRTMGKQPLEGAMEDEWGYDDEWPTRLPTSTRRYTTVPQDETTWEVTQRNRRMVFHTIPPRRSAMQHSLPHPSASNPTQDEEIEDYETERPSRHAPRLRVHWLVFVGLTLLVMLAGFVLLSTVGTWWQTTLDDWHYGRPRTFQIDVVVGHNDSPANPTHFIAMNLNRHVVVIECPGGDCTHAIEYNGPVLLGDGQELTPVTLTFRAATGHSKPDMFVHVADQVLAFVNDGTKFRAAKPGEITP